MKKEIIEILNLIQQRTDITQMDYSKIADRILAVLKEKIKRHSENFKNKYPIKIIGQHHYIRTRDLGYFLEAEKQKWMEENKLVEVPIIGVLDTENKTIIPNEQSNICHELDEKTGEIKRIKLLK
jgi:hypothetical protein